MLVGFTFLARSGQGDALRDLLDAPAAARHVAQSIGATRNILFRHGDRFVRVFEFPEGVKPVPLADVAKRDAGVREFLRRIGRLTETPYDPDDPASLEAFTRSAIMEGVLDVKA